MNSPESQASQPDEQDSDPERRPGLLGWLLYYFPRFMIGLTLLGTAVMLALPGPRDFVVKSSGFIVALDATGLQAYLQEYGSTAWLMSSFLMLLQSLAAPLPAVPITLANALIYGPWVGAAISFGSAQLAALICFWLGRGLGRPFVERLFSRKRVQQFDRFFARYGIFTILIARLIPVIGFDVVSYAAGLTKLRAWPFFIATGIGQLPATIVYSYAGAELANSPSRAAVIALWFIGGMVLLGGISWLRMRHRP